ncbi:DUF4238 domain-containing protein [Streptomyces sp. SCSIO ZS0520]|uniref:DUF4238 domain-containing protein n=1 Tax=Streptomyces sp. SCSIO ZS0520 TaxID=2892996 RepID=UPI0021DA60E7|nr:DUF4238 domain-containing protein [Streptomyces sp. SCSIO ZS0520]
MNEGSPNPWQVAAQQIDARIKELQPEADRHVVGQHVISRVLLKRFAIPFGSQGLKLVPFNLDHPDGLHKAASPRACGKVPYFARFASASLEQVWGKLETRIPDAARAVDRGDVFHNEQHVQTLKDLVALHLVRSLNYRNIHERIFTKVYTEHRTALLTERSDLLRRAVLQRSGLHLSGPQGLATAATAADEILSPHMANFENGADFRARIEITFAKAKEMISDAGLEILVPAAGEFLLGDTPALAIQQSGTRIAFNVAIGDSTAIVLPFGPRHLLVGRTPRNGLSTVSEETVDLLNRLQIEAAQQRVYFRPRSGQDAIVRRYLKQGGRARKEKLQAASSPDGRASKVSGLTRQSPHPLKQARRTVPRSANRQPRSGPAGARRCAEAFVGRLLPSPSAGESPAVPCRRRVRLRPR